MLYNSKVETMPLEQLRSLQSQRLLTLVRKLYDRVPFYREQFLGIGLEPKDIRGMEDLSKLPFTRKTDLRDHYPYGLFAEPQDQIRRIHASSGTTGKPTVVGDKTHYHVVFD
ncbi:MAG: hypothetical protein AAGA85_21225 [Bacteroidota bacterium]